jgi:hypothetical protein
VLSARKHCPPYEAEHAHQAIERSGRPASSSTGRLPDRPVPESADRRPIRSGSRSTNSSTAMRRTTLHANSLRDALSRLRTPSSSKRGTRFFVPANVSYQTSVCFQCQTEPWDCRRFFPAAWASSAFHVARRFGSASSLRFTATGPFDRRSALSDNTQLTGRSRRPNQWATLPIVYPCSWRQKCELPREKKPRS